MFEPGSGLETFGQIFTGMTFLLEISDEEFCDRGVIVDEKEFNGIAWQDFHGWPSVIITIPSISTNLAKCPSSLFFSPKPHAPSIRSINFCGRTRERNNPLAQRPKIPVPQEEALCFRANASSDRIELTGGAKFLVFVGDEFRVLLDKDFPRWPEIKLGRMIPEILAVDPCPD